jgi:hypothetical protein
MRDIKRSPFLSITAAVLLAMALALFSGCSMLLLEDDVVNLTIAGTETLLVVVEESVYGSIEPSILQYREDLSNEGFETLLYEWGGGTAEDLKRMIGQYSDSDDIGGAFLIGDIPSAWYELQGLTGYEEFPCDIFLMDLDAAWQDGDGDGIYDQHSPLDAELFVSRVNGTSLELQRYFDKLHAFRKGMLASNGRAFIFKDNDWADFNTGSTFGLQYLYSSITISESISETSKPHYIDQLSSGGAEFVYQWIHAYPPLLCFDHEQRFHYLDTTDIFNHNLDGFFYNLFNCSASRFTENNVAMTYLMNTDYGLATTGSTKPGGNYYPKAFHYFLSENHTWGDAFRGWYNNYGAGDDPWFLGMVILGDPMLKVTATVQRALAAPLTEIAPDADEIEELQRQLLGFTDNYGELTFGQYREQHPWFFQ